jgi:hypothetical protein
MSEEEEGGEGEGEWVGVQRALRSQTLRRILVL